MAYEELKSKYRSPLVSKHQDLAARESSLKKKILSTKKVISTAHRLIDEEDYDEAESMQYAV